MPEGKTSLEQARPPFHLFLANQKCRVKLPLPSSTSLYVPTTPMLSTGPYSPHALPRVYAPCAHADAYNEVCQCSAEVAERHGRSACPGTCRALD